MKPQEMINVIQAHADGLPVEWIRKTKRTDRDLLSPEETDFNFIEYDYRVKSPTLRPHWPAITMSNDPDGTVRYGVSALLFDHPNRLIGKEGALRLATEYPPVMLP